MSSSASYKCFTSPLEKYQSQSTAPKAGKLIRASRIKQVHVAVPVIWAIMSEKINRVNDSDISEKLCTRKEAGKFPASGAAFCLEVK